ERNFFRRSLKQRLFTLCSRHGRQPQRLFIGAGCSMCRRVLGSGPERSLLIDPLRKALRSKLSFKQAPTRPSFHDGALSSFVPMPIEKTISSAILTAIRSRRHSHSPGNEEGEKHAGRAVASVKLREAKFSDFKAVEELKQRGRLATDSFENWERLWRN